MLRTTLFLSILCHFLFCGAQELLVSNLALSRPIDQEPAKPATKLSFIFKTDLILPTVSLIGIMNDKFLGGSFASELVKNRHSIQLKGGYQKRSSASYFLNKSSICLHYKYYLLTKKPLKGLWLGPYMGLQKQYYRFEDNFTDPTKTYTFERKRNDFIAGGSLGYQFLFNRFALELLGGAGIQIPISVKEVTNYSSDYYSEEHYTYARARRKLLDLQFALNVGYKF